MDKLFLQTLPFLTYDDIEFPYDNLQTTVSELIVSHKYPKIDGALQEPLSRNAIQVSVTAYFINTITPNIYPNQYIKLIDIQQSKEPKTLQHPTLGQFQAFLSNITETNSSSNLDGAILNLSFVETLDETLLNPINTLLLETPNQQVIETSSQKTRPLIPKDKQKQYDSDMQTITNTLVKLTSKATMTVMQINNKINSVKGAINRVTDQLYILQSTVQNSAVTTQLIFELQKFLKQILNQQQAKKTLKTYLTNKDSTIQQLAIILNTSSDNIKDKNPSLLGKFVIPQFTRIYY